MASVAPKIERPPLDRESVERFGLERSEPAWVVEARLAALARYDSLAWPRSDVGEEWRRFPIAEAPLAELARRAGALGASAAPTGASGAIVLPLSRAVREHADLVRPYLEVDGGTHSHEALRAYAHAAWEGGTFVRIPADRTLTESIQVATTTGVSRTIVVAERGSNATVIEELAAPNGGPRLALPFLDVFVEDGASLDYVRLRRYGAEVWDLGGQYYRSSRDSVLASFDVFVGGSRSKVGVASDIVGNGAVVKLYGLVAGGDDQRVDVNTFQDLAASHAESTLLYLAALYDRARAVYYGVIKVEPQTSGTSSYQECRNLLLSEEAAADPIPVLEILTNDVVRCGHGATAGAIDPTEVFYVMSRGLPQPEAERLLVRGFFNRVISRIRDAGIRRRLLDALAPRIGRVAEIDEELAA